MAPLVKAKHPARSDPTREVVEKDKDALWLQLRLLNPRIVIVRGAKAWSALGTASRTATRACSSKRSFYSPSASNIARVVAEIALLLRQYLDEMK